MSVITVNGQQVEVGDDYDRLSPAEQQDTQAEIARQLGHHEEAQQEKGKKEEEANAPVAPFDVSNSQSSIRQYAIDPALAAGSAFGHPAYEAVKTIVSHPVESSIAASYVPGVNRLPGIRDVKAAREALYNKYIKGNPAGASTFDPNATRGGAMGGSTPAPVAPTTAPPAGAGSNVAEQAEAWKTLNTPANELNPRPMGSGPEYNVPKANVPNMPPRPGGPVGFQGANPNGAYSARVPTAGPVAPAATPPVGGAPAQQGSTFLQRMAQQYGSVANRVAPVLQKAAPMVEGAGKMLTPALIAKDLFYTTDAERAILKKAEDEKRARGWHPADPLHGHWTSYYDKQ